MSKRPYLRVIRAKYVGTCNKCSGAIKAGERIFYTKSGLVAYTAHVSCEFQKSGDVKSREPVGSVTFEAAPTQELDGFIASLVKGKDGTDGRHD